MNDSNLGQWFRFHPSGKTHDRALGLLGRLNLALAESGQPPFIILQVGTYDVLAAIGAAPGGVIGTPAASTYGGMSTNESFRRDMESLLRGVAMSCPRSKVVILSIPPVSEVVDSRENNKVREYNDVLRSLCTPTATSPFSATFVDIFSLMVRRLEDLHARRWERTGSKPPPVMIPDESVTQCMGLLPGGRQCGRPFSDGLWGSKRFSGRHHCKYDGRIYCDTCTSKRAYLPLCFQASTQQRVCDACYNELQPLQDILANRRAEPAPFSQDGFAMELSKDTAMMRKYVLRQNWDEVSSSKGFFLLTDHVHLNDIAAKMLCSLLWEYFKTEAIAAESGGMGGAGIITQSTGGVAPPPMPAWQPTGPHVGPQAGGMRPPPPQQGMPYGAGGGGGYGGAGNHVEPV